MQVNTNLKTSEQRVLVFPAQTPMLRGRQVHFLFSLRQADDVLADISVMPVPLSPSYIEGVAAWRSDFLPVISLEKGVGLEFVDSGLETRLAVIRTLPQPGDQNQENRIMVRMAAPIQMLPLPIECAPAANEWPAERNLTRGIYEWKDGWLVVAQLEKILWR